MCMICGGADRDDVLFTIDAAIANYGWFLLGVEGAVPPDLDWVYSIGLAAFGHAELVVVGEIDDGTQVINELGLMIRAGLRLEPGSAVTTSLGRVGIGLVHPRHVENGMAGIWFEYYASVGGPPPTLDLLQVVLPGESCGHHTASSVPRLSDPEARLRQVSTRRPNRADRRARRRSA